MRVLWRKLGLVFSPNQRRDWMHSHAQLPTPGPVRDGVVRVYFASRTAEQRSHVGWVDVQLGLPPRVLRASEAPVLVPGPIGHFDEHGVFPSSIVRADDGRLRMYYVGWTQGQPAPLFYAAIGLAVSEDDGTTFQRSSAAPILARGPHDPCLVTSPNVIRVGSTWRMTYVSGIRWTVGPDGGLRSHYHIKLAESSDGVCWRREGRVAIDFASADETNIARSSVLQLGDGSHVMWYSFLRRPPGRYRLGYATSADGLQWRREDAAVGIDVSEDGFDSEMICYPQVIAYEHQLYMFYNGNRFGADGFGMAVADRPV